MYGRMICALLTITDPLGNPEPLVFTVVPHPGYGSTPEFAHEMLILALTAEWPSLLTADEELLRFPQGLLRSLRTWESDPGVDPSPV